MDSHVSTYVGRCEICDRVKSSFNTLSFQLHPLSIMGLGYHWSLDFARRLVVTPHGAKYVSVMLCGCVLFMCVFAMFLFYLLVLVGTQAAITHNHYLHDIFIKKYVNICHL